MSPRRFSRLLLSLGALLALAGCFVTSENPVAPPDAPARDAGLRGIWLAQEDGKGLITLQILQVEDDTAPGFDALYAGSDGDPETPEDGWWRLRILTHAVNGLAVMSVRVLEQHSGDDPDDIRGWMIFSYKLAGDDLELRMIEEDPVEAAIEAGKLPGKLGDDPHVTATWDQWRKFLSEADTASLFGEEPMRFKRVKRPASE